MAKFQDTAVSSDTQRASVDLTFIYRLIEPDTGDVRYVGKTVKILEHRLGKHISKAVVSLKQNYVCRWIRKLAERGLAPIIELIEIAGDNWAERERYWIAFYRGQGARLTNVTDGGEGAPGFVHSAETKALMSLLKTGKKASEKTRAALSAAGFRRPPASPETRARLKAALMGHVTPPEVRTKISASHLGKVMSDAARLAMSKAQTGRRHSPETRARIGLSGKGRIHSQEARDRISASAIARYADPAMRQRASEAALARFAHPVTGLEAREKLREANRKQFSDPVARENARLRTNLQFSNSEARARASQTTKDWWARRKKVEAQGSLF